jgi:hypothetical protein
MRLAYAFAAGALVVASAHPALGSPCGDRIAALEPKVDEAVSSSQSLSSGGQGVAASREGQAMQAARGEKPPPVQALPEHGVGATAAAKPLAGGDRAVTARAALNRARALDRDGDQAGCLAAVEQVQRDIAPAQ